MATDQEWQQLRNFFTTQPTLLVNIGLGPLPPAVPFNNPSVAADEFPYAAYHLSMLAIRYIYYYRVRIREQAIQMGNQI